MSELLKNIDARTKLAGTNKLEILMFSLGKDLRTGRIICQRRGIDAQSVYYQTLGEGEFHGSQEVIERMAAAIVEEMQADW
jgi:hypothetical protein